MLKLITKRDVCDIFSIELSTLDKWMKEGKISYSKFSNSKQSGVRFDMDDVQKLMNEINVEK